ncbi:Rsp5p-dependent ubiquitination, sorting of cargo proteins at the multivesicular body [Phlyctochytrium planicorne]|nr:Rsp5p-dependent ubiquitination, sorting of cargo proteins at the multivesicular body [Phlyctochytrium planicorne]
MAVFCYRILFRMAKTIHTSSSSTIDHTHYHNPSTMTTTRIYRTSQPPPSSSSNQQQQQQRYTRHSSSSSTSSILRNADNNSNTTRGRNNHISHPTQTQPSTPHPTNNTTTTATTNDDRRSSHRSSSKPRPRPRSLVARNSTSTASSLTDTKFQEPPPSAQPLSAVAVVGLNSEIRNSYATVDDVHAVPSVMQASAMLDGTEKQLIMQQQQIPAQGRNRRSTISSRASSSFVSEVLKALGGSWGTTTGTGSVSIASNAGGGAGGDVQSQEEEGRGREDDLGVDKSGETILTVEELVSVEKVTMHATAGTASNNARSSWSSSNWRKSLEPFWGKSRRTTRLVDENGMPTASFENFLPKAITSPTSPTTPHIAQQPQITTSPTTISAFAATNTTTIASTNSPSSTSKKCPKMIDTNGMPTSPLRAFMPQSSRRQTHSPRKPQEEFGMSQFVRVMVGALLGDQQKHQGPQQQEQEDVMAGDRSAASVGMDFVSRFEDPIPATEKRSVRSGSGGVVVPILRTKQKEGKGERVGILRDVGGVKKKREDLTVDIPNRKRCPSESRARVRSRSKSDSSRHQEVASGGFERNGGVMAAAGGFERNSVGANSTYTSHPSHTYIHHPTATTQPHHPQLPQQHLRHVRSRSLTAIHDDHPSHPPSPATLHHFPRIHNYYHHPHSVRGRPRSHQSRHRRSLSSGRWVNEPPTTTYKPITPISSPAVTVTPPSLPLAIPPPPLPENKMVHPTGDDPLGLKTGMNVSEDGLYVRLCPAPTPPPPESSTVTSLETEEESEVNVFSSTKPKSQPSRTVQTMHALKPLQGLPFCYFEVTIHELAEGTRLFVGLCPKEYPSSSLPGLTAPSISYSSTGHKHTHASPAGLEYGPEFKEGDTIGCGLTVATGGCFFTVNGKYVGEAFYDLGGEYWGAVGGDGFCAFEVRFGGGGFVYGVANGDKEKSIGDGKAVGQVVESAGGDFVVAGMGTQPGAGAGVDPMEMCQCCCCTGECEDTMFDPNRNVAGSTVPIQNGGYSGVPNRIISFPPLTSGTTLMGDRVVPVGIDAVLQGYMMAAGPDSASTGIGSGAIPAGGGMAVIYGSSVPTTPTTIYSIPSMPIFPSALSSPSTATPIAQPSATSYLLESPSVLTRNLTIATTQSSIAWTRGSNASGTPLSMPSGSVLSPVSGGTGVVYVPMTDPNNVDAVLGRLFVNAGQTEGSATSFSAASGSRGGGGDGAGGEDEFVESGGDPREPAFQRVMQPPGPAATMSAPRTRPPRHRIHSLSSASASPIMTSPAWTGDPPSIGTSNNGDIPNPTAVMTTSSQAYDTIEASAPATTAIHIQPPMPSWPPHLHHFYTRSEVDSLRPSTATDSEDGFDRSGALLSPTSAVGIGPMSMSRTISAGNTSLGRARNLAKKSNMSLGSWGVLDDFLREREREGDAVPPLPSSKLHVAVAVEKDDEEEIGDEREVMRRRRVSLLEYNGDSGLRRGESVGSVGEKSDVVVVMETDEGDL